MPAIEYGTYYWGVILNGTGSQNVGETVHLHADQMRIDGNGALVFTSAGRRAAGTDPDQNRNGQDEKNSSQHTSPPNEKKDAKDEKKDSGGEADKDMIYVAFAPGT